MSANSHKIRQKISSLHKNQARPSVATTPSSGLTPKQQKVLLFIEQFTQDKGYAPSQKEIAQAFGFNSLGTVQNYLVRLQSHGLIQKSWNAKRSVQPCSPVSHNTHWLPLVGRVAAGYPLEAISNEELIEVPRSLVRAGKDHFVLQVNGESMRDDGIFNGDYVIIEKTPSAKSGQTVVALIDGEATLKKFFRNNQEGHIELHPANENFHPIIVTAEQNFEILGTLTGIIRRYS